MILSLLSSVISFIFLELAANLGAASLYVILVFAVVTTILQIKLVIKRSHDLGKTGWYSYIPLFLMAVWVPIAGVVSGGILPLLTSLYSLYQNSLEALSVRDFSAFIEVLRNSSVTLVALIAGVLFVRFICRGIVVALFKGNTGDNKYGSDPLVFQPASNTNYWVVGLLAFVLSMLLSSFTQDTNESMYNNLMMNSSGEAVDQDLNVGEGDEMIQTDTGSLETDMVDDTQRVDMTASGVTNDTMPSDTPTMDSTTEQPAIDPMESAEGGV